MRRTKRILAQEASLKVDVESIVYRLKLPFKVPNDPVLLSELGWATRKFTMFTDKDLPLKTYRETLIKYIEVKTKEVKILEKNEKFRYNLFSEADEILESAQQQLKRAEIKFDDIKNIPVLKGRQEDFFTNTFIEELLTTRVNHGLSIKNSYNPDKEEPFGECLDWICEALTISGYKFQSRNAVDRKIDRIIKNNKPLRESQNS